MKESLLRRKYVIPFVLACVILACNQATGVNSIIGYNTNILLQSGLSDVQAHWGYVIFTIVNFLMTMAGVMLVDRKGRKFLLSVGTAGIIVSLSLRRPALPPDGEPARGFQERGSVHGPRRQKFTLHIRSRNSRNTLLACCRRKRDRKSRVGPTSLVVIYSYGDFRAATKVARSDDTAATPIEITSRKLRARKQSGRVFFQSVWRSRCRAPAPLTIDNALITPFPASATDG